MKNLGGTVRFLTIPFVVLLAIVMASEFGNAFPIRSANIRMIFTDVTLLVGYMYLTRSLFRLPFVVIFTRRHILRAQQTYQLSRAESLSDGILRGVYDRRRWQKGNLAVLDRTVLVLLVMVTTVPTTGAALMRGLGVLGIIMMLVVYAYTGKFGFILGEPQDTQSQSARAMPFIDLGS